jgi:hypothetical protein
VQGVVRTQVAAQPFGNVVGRRRFIARQHLRAVGNLLLHQLGKQRLLAGEVAIEGAAGQADARHQLVDARRAEPTPLGDGSGIADELLASLLFVRAGIAHECTSANLEPTVARA